MMVILGWCLVLSACVEIDPFSGCRADTECGDGQACEANVCVARTGVDVTCDAVDDDADGRLDEDAAESPAAQVLVGVCVDARLVCERGEWLEPIYDDIDGYEAIETLCDGLDNDCDGTVDEGEGGCTYCVPGSPGHAAPPCNGCPETVIVPQGWVCMPPGTYEHGYHQMCPDEGCAPGFRPVREVEITRPFLMMATEVTQAQYREVMEENPSSQRDCPQCPVDRARPEDFFEYANRFSEAHGLTACYAKVGQAWAWSDFDCDGYRLPTDVEWEYGARGKAPHGQYWWDGLHVAQVMWLSRNASVPRSEGRCRVGDEPSEDASAFARDNCTISHPVGGLLPNPWGLFDTAGNAWEVLFDPIEGRWPEDVRTDPVGGFGPEGRGHRGFMIGGGGASNPAKWYPDPGYRHSECCGGDFIGFRLVRTPLPAP